MAILLAIAVLWISAGFGRTILCRVTALDESKLLRFAYAGAIGLAIAAYGILLIGLSGLLSFWPVTLLWLGMACTGFRGIQRNSQDFAAFLRATITSISSISVRTPRSLVAPAAVAALIFLGAAAAITCFKPPAGLEWDAISYHLADPAQFLMAHRVFNIPTEHHSNFPFLMEMLYTAGLLYNGYALANLLHLCTAVLTVAAIFAFARRLQGSVCGWIAAILFVSTPVVYWESSVAYVEIGQGLFTTLAVLAVVRGLISSGQSRAQRDQWLLLCAVCAGFALGIKYLALVPLALILITILVRSRSSRKAAAFIAVALAIASPWYIKNAVVMHNPVYPFFYKLFPGSKYWSAGRAAGYEAEQSRFGSGHSLKKQPGEAVSNLLQVPWDLVTLPLANRGTYSNDGEFTFLTLVGGLVFAFNALLLLRRRVSKEAAAILLLGAAQVAAWFFIAQVSRYLVSVLPLLAISGACGLSGLINDAASRPIRSFRTTAQVVAWLAVLLLTAQVLMLAWVVTFPPPQSSIAGLPQIVEVMASQDTANTYLERHLDTFAITDWINKNTPRDAGVLLYDDTRGFYIDRPYMWANENHSSYIPYEKFNDGQELTDWMLRKNYRYAMFDMNWAPQNADRSHADPDLANGPKGNETEAFQQWYASAPLQPIGYSGYRWQGLVADAYRRGLWTDAGVAKNGVILLKIGSDSEGATK